MRMLFLPPAFRNVFLASSTRTATRDGSGSTGSVPVSMRATSSRLLIRSRMWSAWLSMIRKNCAISAGSRSEESSIRVAADPLMEVRGVLSSWLTIPRNSARRRSSSSSGVMSCRVTTTDSTFTSSERMGVALTRVVTDRPSGAWRTISSASTVSPVRSAWARGNSSRDISRPSARRKVSTSSSCSAEPFGAHRSLTILLASRFTDTGFPVLASKTRTPTGAVFTRVSRSVPDPLLLPVPAGVGDDQRRLGGEHHQGLLVLLGELPLLLADVDGSDVLAPVTERSGQNGEDKTLHRRADRRHGSLLQEQGADHHRALPGGGPGLVEEATRVPADAGRRQTRTLRHHRPLAVRPPQQGGCTPAAALMEVVEAHQIRLESRLGRYRHEDLRTHGGHRQDRAGQLPGAVHYGQAGDGQAGTGAHRRPPLRIPHRRRRQARGG